MAAIKSSPECSASERMPRLPVATARNTFSPTRTKAEPIDPSAAICFTELGDRVMRNPRKDYTMFQGGAGLVAQTSACVVLIWVLRTTDKQTRLKTTQARKTLLLINRRLRNFGHTFPFYSCPPKFPAVEKQRSR